jgi:kynurenine formamidase
MSQDARRDGVPRRWLLGLASSLGLLGVAAKPAFAAPIAPAAAKLSLHGRPIRVVDLTHELTSDFNLGPRPRISMQPIEGSGAAVGMKLNMLSLNEHTGTHIDAPRHFSDTAPSLGEIPVGDLVVPLAVLDLKAKAARDSDASVEVADILAWERRHGRLPDGCCVAVNAGWDPLAARGRALSQPGGARGGSPGFGLEAAEMLMRQRRVKGIAVDALSIDTGGHTPAYPVHQAWLRSGRWGIEGLANLDAVPASGALLVVGAAPIKDATGMPIRALAIF